MLFPISADYLYAADPATLFLSFFFQVQKNFPGLCGMSSVLVCPLLNNHSRTHTIKFSFTDICLSPCGVALLPFSHS